jgi:hypothetical protein
VVQVTPGSSSISRKEEQEKEKNKTSAVSETEPPCHTLTSDISHGTDGCLSVNICFDLGHVGAVSFLLTL